LKNKYVLRNAFPRIILRIKTSRAMSSDLVLLVMIMKNNMNTTSRGPITSPSSRYSSEKSEKNKDTILGEKRGLIIISFF